MIELPRVPVNFVNAYSGLSYSVEEFQSDSGLSTRVARACRGFGYEFELSYEGLKPDEAGQFICFFNEIQLDKSSGVSFETVTVPANHPFWDKVSTRSYIEKLLLPDQTIDNALWVAVSPGNISVPRVNFHDFKFNLRNVYE